MGGCISGSSIDHDCDNKDCVIKRHKSDKFKCIWHPSRPYRWEFTINHKKALQSALETDKSIRITISSDVMNIIELYINQITDKCVTEMKENQIYYKYIRSNVYDPTEISNSSTNICSEYFNKFFYTNPEKYHHKRLRIVVVGEGYVGKTYLCDRVIKDEYEPYEYDCGIEDVLMKTISISDGQQWTIELLDTYGQEEFIIMQDEFIRRSDVIWLCFDVMRKRTFQWVLDKFEYIKKQRIQYMDLERVCVIFVGCKNDLRFGGVGTGLMKIQLGRHFADDPVDTFDVMKEIEKLGNYPYIETSAKTGENAHYLFECSVYEAWLQSQIDCF